MTTVKTYLLTICIVGLLQLLLIGVSDAVPEADFSANITSGPAPLTVRFADESFTAPTGWSWFFGDETYAGTWTEMNASSGWVARLGHASVALPDGSVALIAGEDNGSKQNDIWLSADKGATWALMNASIWNSGRVNPTSVVRPDGSGIVVMGGLTGWYMNDVWVSSDTGALWLPVNESSAWSQRARHSSVALTDGSIILMGGYTNSGLSNETWRSTDGGNLWTLMNASPGWSARASHSSVALHDNSIVLTGGWDGTMQLNETWRSTDYGAHWTRMNASSGWLPREGHTSVPMPDGSIVLMGGTGGLPGYYKDIWRSTDNGATWTQVNDDAGWERRVAHSSVVLPDGSIVLMGGNQYGLKNDTWRLQPAGSIQQNPIHTYTTPGTYSVTLQAYNPTGYNSMRKLGYITVIAPVSGTSRIGLFRPSTQMWYLDYDNNGLSNYKVKWGDSTDMPVAGDWDGDNMDEIGLYRPSTQMWYLDYDNSGLSDFKVKWGDSTDMPVAGKWS
jgi:hypothetical protein